MDRRGFIGSVIGTVAGIAFSARLPTEPWQRVIKPYRMAFRDSKSGFVIQAPGVQAIEKMEHGYRFIAEELKVLQTMSVDSVMVLKPNGQVVRTGFFQSSVHMCNGDALRVTYDLNLIGLNKPNPLSVDELTDLFIKYPKGDIPKEVIYGPDSSRKS